MVSLLYQADVNEHFYHPQRSWGKVMFLQVSVILLTGGRGIPHPPWADPLGVDTTPTPTPSRPPSRQPPRSRHPHPPEQTPWSRHPPGADPPGADPPPRADTPGADTLYRADTPSPLSRHPPRSRHPPEQTPPRQACCEIRPTRRWYASYWNAILLRLFLLLKMYFKLIIPQNNS